MTYRTEFKLRALRASAFWPVGVAGGSHVASLAVAFAVTMVTSAAFAGATQPEQPLAFPDDARLVNVVTEYGATPNDDKDDTAAIQEAFEQNKGNGSIIYLPPGEYIISDTIRWRGRASDNILQGAGPGYTVIRLVDNAPGFDDPKKPRSMFWTGSAPAQRFRNAVRDLTIDAGDGNPGAVGLTFTANNQGTVNNVVIRSGRDGTSPGAVGLALDEPEVGPLLVRNVTVLGFDIGVRVRHTVNSVTLEHIELSGQREAGIDNFNNYVFVRKLASRNAVPAVVNAGKDGIITLIDSRLEGVGDAEGRSAMLNRNARAVLFARNVEVAGYAQAVSGEAVETVPTGHIDEWVSGPRLSLFPGEMRTLNLPVRETPAVPHDPLEQWASPIHFGGLPGDGEDDTAAIQKAIDSGATTIYLPRAKESSNPNDPGRKGSYEISDTIYIRGNVRRIVGLEAKLEVMKNMHETPEKPIFVFEDGAHPVVVIERLKFSFDRFPNPTFVHRAERDLVISSFSEVSNTRHEGTGTLFMDDVVGSPVTLSPGATLYARQFNLEGGDFKFINDGGTAWIMGIKTECRAPVALTKNGGTTEIIGGHLYKCVEQGVDKVAFVVEDAKMSLAGVAEYVWDPKYATHTLVQETRDGKTKTLTKHEVPEHGNAASLPLVACFPTDVKGQAPGEPRVSVLEQSGGSILLGFEADDADGDLVGFEVRRGDKHLGRHVASARDRGLAPSTRYTYTVTAYDRFGNTSTPVEFTATTPGDTVPPSRPENFRALKVTDQRVLLAWRGSSDEIGVAGYAVERTDAAGEAAVLGKQPGTEFNDDKVIKGTTYTYRIYAYDDAGNRSEPGVLEVPVPSHPPYELTQEAERFAKHAGNVQKNWYIFNLHGGCWMLYPDLELGRDKPFDQISIRYGTPNDRGGSIIKVVVDPVIEEVNGKHRIVDGEQVAEFVVQGTGGWGDFQTFTQPMSLNKGGVRQVALLIERGDAKHPNALVNIDWFRVGYAEPPASE